MLNISQSEKMTTLMVSICYVGKFLRRNFNDYLYLWSSKFGVSFINICFSLKILLFPLSITITPKNKLFREPKTHGSKLEHIKKLMVKRPGLFTLAHKRGLATFYLFKTNDWANATTDTSCYFQYTCSDSI